MKNNNHGNTSMDNGSDNNNINNSEDNSNDEYWEEKGQHCLCLGALDYYDILLLPSETLQLHQTHKQVVCNTPCVFYREKGHPFFQGELKFP